MILDTTFIIDLLKNKPNAVNRMCSMIEDGVSTCITSPTVFELHSGLVALDKPEAEKRKIISLLKEQIVYPLDIDSAELAGKIDGDLIRRGLTIDAAACMIAGIAITHHKKVLTRDEHFKRIDGLRVAEY